MTEATAITQETRDYVRTIALRMLRDAADAEDVTQDALLLAFRYRDSFRGDALYKTWLHRITQTAALMFLRKRRRYLRETSATVGCDAEEVSGVLERASTPATAVQHIWCRQQLDRTRGVVARLGPRYPEVYWRRYAEGYTETEIARDLGLSLATVKTRAHRAKLAVAASVEAAEEEAAAEASTQTSSQASAQTSSQASTALAVPRAANNGSAVADSRGRCAAPAHAAQGPVTRRARTAAHAARTAETEHAAPAVPAPTLHAA